MAAMQQRGCGTAILAHRATQSLQPNQHAMAKVNVTTDIRGFQIMEILQLKLYDFELLDEVHLNLESAGRRSSLCLCIAPDGESIVVKQNRHWKTTEMIEYMDGAITFVKQEDPLASLYGDVIQDVRYGYSTDPETDQEGVHYLQIRTDKRDFLFFNAGDEFGFGFDKTEEILQQDIFGTQWREGLPPNYVFEMP